MGKINLHTVNKYTESYIKGKLSSKDEEELLGWINASAENKSLFLKKQERISNSILDKKVRLIDPSWNRLSKKITTEDIRRSKRMKLRGIASIAAAFLIGIIFTSIILNKYRFGQIQSAQYQTVQVPYGAKSSIELPDGSKVVINSGSKFSYPLVFGKTRPVTLNGEAYFEVEKGKKPFVVSTEYGDVKVLGTTFNVKAYADEMLQTTLVSGSVEVYDDIDETGVLLKPGQQATLDDGIFNLENVKTEIFTSWIDGKLIFRKEYLPKVAKRLERWYNVKITVDDDPKLEEIWFNGTVEMESLPEVLELLKVTSPIDYAYNNKERIVEIKYRNGTKE